MSDELIQDIEDSLKQDRLTELWKEYGPWLIGGVIVAVLLTATITGWRSWNENVNTEQTAQILQALDSENMTASLAEITDDLRPGQAALARLTAAGLLLRDGKQAEALREYEAIIAQKSTPAPFQDLATLMFVRLNWAQTPDASADDAAKAIAQLLPVVNDQNSPWQAQAAIQAALIAAHGQHDYTKAREYLETVTARNDLPASLRDRAAALHHLYEVQKGRQMPASANAVIEEKGTKE